MSSSCSRSRTRLVLRYISARYRSPRRSFTSSPASVVASEAIGDGPEYRYGGAATLSTFFKRVGSARNDSSDEYDLENPATRITFSYVSPWWRTTPLPSVPYGLSSSGERSPI